MEWAAEHYASIFSIWKSALTKKKKNQRNFKVVPINIKGPNLNHLKAYQKPHQVRHQHRWDWASKVVPINTKGPNLKLSEGIPKAASGEAPAQVVNQEYEGGNDFPQAWWIWTAQRWGSCVEALLGCPILHYIVRSALSLVWVRREKVMLIIGVWSPTWIFYLIYCQLAV